MDKKTRNRQRDNCVFTGGPEGVRTLDLRDANAALSQLSHGPEFHKQVLL